MGDVDGQIDHPAAAVQGPPEGQAAPCGETEAGGTAAGAGARVEAGGGGVMTTERRLRLTIRIAALILTAQSHRYLPSLEDLAREHGVSTRTIRRDLEALEAVGVPLPPRSCAEAA